MSATVERLSREAIPSRYSVEEMVVTPFENRRDTLLLRARDSKSGKQVYVKSRLSAMLLENEAKALDRHNHPQIPKIVELALDAEQPFLALEAMPNERGLSRQLTIKPNPKLAARMCLSAVHGAGWGHFDVKPDNLGLNREQPVALLDFDATQPLGEDPRIAAAKGLLLATAGFASPQRVTLQPGSVQDDIYSMGVTLHRLSGMAGLPPGLQSIVLNARHPDPAERYESAEAMAYDLNAWLAT